MNSDEVLKPRNPAPFPGAPEINDPLGPWTIPIRASWYPEVVQMAYPLQAGSMDGLANGMRAQTIRDSGLNVEPEWKK